MLPVTGAAWQAMRLSRNRNWGHPALVAYLEKLGADAKKLVGWPGLLIGDMAQPWGGPMVTGHASHQIGLDADIWLTPMPDHVLSVKEREETSARSMLAADKQSVDPKIWTEKQAALIKRAVSYPQVARIFVHPAIKKALCESAGKDRDWLRKVRPWWGHHYHFHVRLKCPAGSPSCKDQAAPPPGDGCGKELTQWLRRVKPAKIPPKTPPKKKKPLTMADLPKECSALAAQAEHMAAAQAAPIPTASTSALTPEAPSAQNAAFDGSQAKSEGDGAAAGGEHPRDSGGAK
jgi:penicillin-insensitive murein endopeptidase